VTLRSTYKKEEEKKGEGDRQDKWRGEKKEKKGGGAG